MTEQELRDIFNELITLPSENECVEFKEAKNNFNFDTLGEYFSALSNEANLMDKQCSWLVFGVIDKTRKICNTQYRINRKDLDNLKKEIGDKTTGRVTFMEIYDLNLPEGRVIMFQIPPAPQGIPIAWDGHYFGRDGESTVALNISEIESIRNQSRNEDWSSHFCDGATIADLDSEAIARARIIYKNKHEHLESEVDSWDDITFLNNNKLWIFFLLDSH